MFKRTLLLATTILAGLSLAACASSTTPEASAPTAPLNQKATEISTENDPIEPANRFVFDINDFLDRLLIAPLAGLYRVTVPPPVRDRVSNMLDNMEEPVIMANNLMQGEFTNAGTTFARLATNSTLGLAGMFEVANDFGLEQQRGDFGQTLHTWGFGSGPYLVLPLFGPSNIRDAIGMGVDTLISPWKYAAANGGGDIKTIYTYSDMGASALSKREAVLEAYDSLREGSLDFYAQMRSVYRQHRAKELGEATSESTPQFEDYDNEVQTPVVH